MRVAMVVGLLIFNVVAGFYASDVAGIANGDAGLSRGADVHASSDFPPPAWP